jgi:hypothetical protein
VVASSFQQKAPFAGILYSAIVLLLLSDRSSDVYENLRRGLPAKAKPLIAETIIRRLRV